ncbi:MAG: PDZ domain-containing protein [Candidatus Aminicenantes bacterium]|nr:PDZ domain-containing protein [Candidatus Aminicenantes bacterium]
MTRTIKTIALPAAFLMIATLGAQAAPIDPAKSGLGEQKIEEITKMVAPSVVRVEARNGMRKVATGVVINKDGYIVTTALISPRDEEISVLTTDGKRLKAEFKGLDTQTHVALIQVKEKGLTPIALGKAADMKPGAWIGVVGLSPENTAAVTQGIVSSVAADKLRLNVWVVPGMSGSPVVNGSGQMVGLLRGAYTDEQPFVFEFREQQVVGSGTVISRAEAPSSGMALAVPVDIVQSIASDLEKKGKVERGWLGVQAGERQDGKLEVAEVEPKSPAELAKIKEGDVIVKIDGKDIASGEALQWEIRSRKPGQDITVRIERNGKPQDLKVKLGEYTEEDAKRELFQAFPRLFPPETPAPGRSAPQAQPKVWALPKGKLGILPFAWESRKFIGVTLQELNKDSVGALFGIKDGIGLLVAEITADGPAAKAGLKVGDLILKADGKRLQAVSELSDMLQDKKKGDKVKIELMRDKKTMTLDIEIGEEESGPEELLFRGLSDYSTTMPELLKRNDESSKKQIEEFFRKNEETVKKFQDELKKKSTIRNEYGKIIRIISDSGEIE